MKGPPLGPGGEDITWPDQVAPRGRKASSTREIKPETSNLTYRKTRRYTNVVRCKVLSSRGLARRATIQMLFVVYTC